MTRTALTDKSGGWFDKSKAASFEESSFWDGHNLISRATGSQWHHQTLWRTASLRWVLESYGQWQGSRDTYEEVTDTEAAQWFMRNQYEDADIPDDLLAILSPDIKKLEI